MNFSNILDPSRASCCKLFSNSTKVQHVMVFCSVLGLIALLNLMTFLPAGPTLLIYERKLKIGIVYIL